MSRRQAKDSVFEQFARVGKALSSRKRVELLDLIAQGARSVESLARAANQTVTTASARLQVQRIAENHDGVLEGAAAELPIESVAVA